VEAEAGAAAIATAAAGAEIPEAEILEEETPAAGAETLVAVETSSTE
jgi:hypothetical protein